MTIPTIGQSELLLPLVRSLEQDDAIDKIILTVNLEEYFEPVREFFRFAGPKVIVMDMSYAGRSIHHGWNNSIMWAQDSNAYLAVLNDDIRIFDPQAISQVARLLAESPKYALIGLNGHEAPDSTPEGAKSVREVHGSYRHHGVWGCAWVCDPHKIETVPDDLVHWGGDDFIFFRAMDAGYKLGIASHAHIEHPAPETTAFYQPWTHEARGRDREAFDRYYPGRAW